MKRTQLSDLSDEIKQSLTPEQIEARGGVIFPSAGNSFRHYFFFIIALSWLLALFASAYDLRWGTARLAIAAVVTVAAFYFPVRGLISILRSRSRHLPEGLIVDNRLVLLIGPTSVECWSLDELISVDYAHKYQDRRYLHSDLQLAFPDTQKNIRVKDLEETEDAADRISELRKSYLQAAARGELDGLEGFENSAQENATNPVRTIVDRVVPLAASVVLGVLAVGSAYGLNEYFDDKLSWDMAVSNGTASGCRQYLRTHPEGRWNEPASKSLDEFYEQAESRYRSALGPNHDAAAVEALLALLKYARATHNFRVGVKFRRTADIPEDLTERIKEDFEVKNVLPLGTTFTQEKMEVREAALFGVMVATFRQIFPEDVVEITTDCWEGCSTFSVSYETTFLDSIYYDLKEKDIPREDRNWSPGILIDWNFKLSIPDDAREYEFDLESAPAETINYDSVDSMAVIPGDREPTTDLNQESFYDAMVNSAFDDFKQHLLFNFGMGPEPHLDQTEGNQR